MIGLFPSSFPVRSSIRQWKNYQNWSTSAKLGVMTSRLATANRSRVSIHIRQTVLAYVMGLQIFLAHEVQPLGSGGVVDPIKSHAWPRMGYCLPESHASGAAGGSVMQISDEHGEQNAGDHSEHTAERFERHWRRDTRSRCLSSRWRYARQIAQRLRPTWGRPI